MWHRFSCRCSTVPTREDTPLSLEKPIFELGSDRELLEMRFMERCFGPQVCRMKTPLMPTHPWCGFVHCKNFKIVWSYWSRVFFFFQSMDPREFTLWFRLKVCKNEATLMWHRFHAKILAFSTQEINTYSSLNQFRAQQQTLWRGVWTRDLCTWTLM